MMNKITAFLRDESGESATEYALIVAVIGAAVAAAMVSLGANIRDAITNGASIKPIK